MAAADRCCELAQAPVVEAASRHLDQDPGEQFVTESPIAR